MSAYMNMVSPRPPHLSCGCFNCGGGKDEVLESHLRNGACVALCSGCKGLPERQLHTQPHDARGAGEGRHVS